MKNKILNDSEIVYCYLIDKHKNKFIDFVNAPKSCLNLFLNVAVNKLIKKNNGIKSNQIVRFSIGKLLTPDESRKW